MYVAIDTNALPNGWNIRARIVRELISFLRNTNSKLLLSDVVRIEAAANYSRECKAALDRLGIALHKASSIFIGVEELDKASVLDRALTSHHQSISDEIPDGILQPLPINGGLMEEIVHRLAEKRPPSSVKGAGFRDCAIWLALLDYAEKNPSHRPIVLISNDKEAFSADNISLYAELQEELQERGFEISHYQSIEAFLAAQKVELPEEGLLASGHVKLTGGSLGIVGASRGPQFEFRARDFDISSINADQGNVWLQASWPFKPGQVLSLSSTFLGNLGLGAGPATIRDKEYDRLYYAGEINFGGQAEIPPDSVTPQVFIHGDFGFRGWMQGFERNPFVGNPGRSVFDVKLSGRGTATIELTGSFEEHYGLLYYFRGIIYQFQE